MLPFLISAALFVILASSIIWFGYRIYARPARALGSLASPVPGLSEEATAPVTGAGLALRSGVTRFLQWVGEKAPKNPLTSSITRRQLMAAGFRSDAVLPVFYAIRIIAVAFLAMAALAFTYLTGWHPVFKFGIPAVAGLLGFMLSNLGLDLLGERYQEILRASLPDVLELLIVAVEAGLGLDQALLKVSQELALTHPEICQELGLVSMEIRTGVKRADAMHNMADRTMEPEIRKFVAVMVQTDRFGTSIAESLRAHAEFMRIRRRQLAEEKANKLGVKMTIVVFFFILPAILIVSGGPVFLRIFKELLPALQSASQ